MKGLQRINSIELIDDFVTLWHCMQTVTLSADEDSITWTQASNNTYSAADAYEACFVDRAPKPLLAAT
jgi:hypothetical protein